MAITQETLLPLKYGKFRIAYHRLKDGDCVSISYGNVTKGVPIIRFHSSCLFGEALHGMDCDCAMQLTSTLKLIKDNKSGAVIYHYAEGRGIGLENKIRALEIQRTKGVDTVEAFALMGFGPDLRTYEPLLDALHDLGVPRTIRFASQNPKKLAAVENAGFNIVETLHPVIRVNRHNKSELLTKKHKLGYDIRSI